MPLRSAISRTCPPSTDTCCPRSTGRFTTVFQQLFIPRLSVFDHVGTAGTASLPNGTSLVRGRTRAVQGRGETLPSI